MGGARELGHHDRERRHERTLRDAHLAAQAPALAAATFCPSLVFGYFRDRYDSIAPGAALHVFYNAGWFLLTGG